MIVTMNARSLLNFFAHRCCNRAQWEIRELAEQMLALCLEAAPALFRFAHPPCTSRRLPGGKNVLRQGGGDPRPLSENEKITRFEGTDETMGRLAVIDGLDGSGKPRSLTG